MTDRPILFSGPMVRAIIDGTKTQTRRVLKVQPPKWQAMVIDITEPFFCEEEQEWGQVETIWSGPLVPGMCEPEREEWRPLKGLHYAIGDRLWVRETWRAHKNWNSAKPNNISTRSRIWYDADERDNCDQHGKTRVSIHMPRWASRLTLTVTDVRVQRLKDISTEDVLAEGAPLCPYHTDYTQDGTNPYMCTIEGRHGTQSPHAWYHRLWDSINGPDAWCANPWVVAVSFTVERRNIDA